MTTKSSPDFQISCAPAKQGWSTSEVVGIVATSIPIGVWLHSNLWPTTPTTQLRALGKLRAAIENDFDIASKNEVLPPQELLEIQIGLKSDSDIIADMYQNAKSLSTLSSIKKFLPMKYDLWHVQGRLRSLKDRIDDATNVYNSRIVDATPEQRLREEVILETKRACRKAIKASEMTRELSPDQIEAVSKTNEKAGEILRLFSSGPNQLNHPSSLWLNVSESPSGSNCMFTSDSPYEIDCSVASGSSKPDDVFSMILQGHPHIRDHVVVTFRPLESDNNTANSGDDNTCGVGSSSNDKAVEARVLDRSTG